MATRNAFYEELQRYGIDASTVSKVEIKKGSSLVVYVDNKEIKINDPYLVKLAKLATLNAQLDLELPRKQLLKRLYGVMTVFRGIIMPFSEFVYRNTGLSSKELAERLENLEREHSVTEEPEMYRDGLKFRICRKLTDEFGISFKDFEEIVKNSTTENLLSALTELYF